jgi:uncharacterized protein
MKNPIHFLNRIGLCISAIALAGCTFLSPVKDTSKFYVLTPAAAEGGGSQASQASTAGLVLGLGPIRFPDYLDRSEIVTRIEPNQLQMSENDRWAESLKDNFNRVLSQDLSNLLGTQQIINFPWYSTTHVDYQIAIIVDRFECDNQGSARLAARWSIADPVSGRILNRHDADLNVPYGGSIDQCAASLSQSLGSFSQQIATAVTQLSATRRSESTE